MTDVLVPAAVPVRPRGVGGNRLGRWSGLGLGAAVGYLSLLVLLPLAAIVDRGAGGGWQAFESALTSPTAAAALRLTVLSALLVTAVNTVFGTAIAWVLVRDRFRGQRALDLLIDIPFALPTIVAGLVLLSLYGADSPLGLHWYGTRLGIEVALLFVTLPFVVRSVQPVLLELDREAELAAACLGAGPVTTFRRIVLPALAPAMLSGAALAFARAVGEYGSVTLISGNLERHTQVASAFIYQQIQNDDLAGASATATVLLFISLVVLGAVTAIKHRMARRG